MANLLLGNVIIRGVRTILWHAFSPDSIPLSRRKERTGVAGNDPQEWRSTVLVTENQQLYLPHMAIFSCLVSAAQYTRRGRGTLQRSLSATLQVVDERLLLDRYLPDPITSDPTQPVFLDVRSVRNPTTKARNVRYRVAAGAGWTASFSILWDRSIVSRPELEAIVIDAGRLVGIGSGRSIGFGRFRLDRMQVVEAEAVDAMDEDGS